MPETEATKIADAVLIPESMKRGERSAQRVASISDITDPLLGVDLSKGERSWIRRTTMFAADGSNYNFATKSIEDSYHYPANGPRTNQDRYRWETLNGPGQPVIKLGYLIEEGERKSVTIVGK